MAAIWADNFKKMYPDVEIDIQVKGSANAVTSVLEGQATFGLLSRAITAEEVTAFQQKFGYPPHVLTPSFEAIAIYVHKDNPLKGLTMQQVDAIFSKTRKTGAPADIKTWGDLGLDGNWKDKPIVLHGRNSASGSYGYFKFHGLAKGDFKDEVNEQPGSSAVVEAVGKDRYAIGYAGIAYRTDAVAPVPLARDEKSDAVPPVAEKVDDYLLGRHFYLYVNFKPGSNLEPVRREYLRYVFSVDGQNDVVKDGYLPIDAATAKNEAAKVGIEIEVKK